MTSLSISVQTAGRLSHQLCRSSRLAVKAFTNSSTVPFHSGYSCRCASTASTSSKEKSNSKGEDNEARSKPSFFNSTGWGTAMGASAGVLLLGAAAMLYQASYKARVIQKMEAAFNGGYDPILALVENSNQLPYIHLDPPRPEEELIDHIIQGKEKGRYFLILGSKGSGKTSMIIQAMLQHKAEGCAFFEAHPDPSIVVDRFSEAINFSMNRDYLGNLLGLSDLSGMTIYQQVERALHKLEKAVIRYSNRTGRPAVIIMNSAHLLPKDPDGKIMLTLFQQRAEKWASAGLATFIFIAQDYFVYDILRKNSVRMDTLTFTDLTRSQSLDALRKCRQFYWGDEIAAKEAESGILEQAYEILGGRMGLINSISRRRNLLRAVNQMVEDDMHWLLSKTGIIEDHDDDVMDEQKWSTCSWLLFLELAKRQAQLEADRSAANRSKSIQDDESDEPPDPDLDRGQVAVTDPSRDVEEDIRGLDVPNPHLTWGEARQVMTRPDFITELDTLNIIHIDRHHRLSADSMPLLRAFRRVAETKGFEEKLENVMDRVSAIESLGRTRELVWKEQGDKGRFLVRRDAKGRELEGWTLLGGDERLGRDDDKEKAEP